MAARAPALRRAFGRIMPWIDQRNTHRFKISHIPGDDGHAVHERGRRDKGIAFRPGIRHMQADTTLCHFRIDNQDPLREFRKDVMVQPNPQDGTLSRKDRPGGFRYRCEADRIRYPRHRA
jgi:hypothetical protein